MHLTKLMSWSNHDRDWKNGNSLFKRSFRGRHRRGILNSLLYVEFTQVNFIDLCGIVQFVKASIFY